MSGPHTHPSPPPLTRPAPPPRLTPPRPAPPRCNASLPAAAAAARALVSAASPWGVPLITYEAGPSLVEAAALQSGTTTTPGLAAKLTAASRHPAMYGLYRSYLAAAVAAGLVSGGGEGRPYMQFVSTALPSQYGSWGLQVRGAGRRAGGWLRR